MSQESTAYDAARIQVLEGREAVRRRPGMYIGSTGERGLSHLVFEVADRAVNEVLAGVGSRVDVTLLLDGGVRVADDGAGVPLHEARGGGPALEALLTRTWAGVGPGGRHDVALGGVGLSVVNALSGRMTAEVRREGARWVQEYARGVALTPLTEAGPAAASGTTLTFWRDTDIFPTAGYSFDALAERFRELALLNRGLEISLTDERRPGDRRSVRFRFPGGTRDFVALLDARDPAPAATAVIGVEGEDPRMAGTVEVALRWRDAGEERIRSFANSRPTAGGTHVVGFRDGVAAAVTAYARKRLLPGATDPGLTAEQVGAGLTAVVSVKLDDPEFEGCIRDLLGNTAVRACVARAVRDRLGAWLEGHPEQAAAIVGRLVRGA
ncbi:ATP-binding protein [Streptomyces sp. NRRL S-350]|uniref:ATP-binding protein n=1 Tax=Streptomyces sp. NRRL S-350 TaxID=1463902 RepID=UPI0004C042B8|nr:ATP-binding protein [Streptomyces sp. NRRL S-350]